LNKICYKYVLRGPQSRSKGGKKGKKEKEREEDHLAAWSRIRGKFPRGTRLIHHFEAKKEKG